MEKYTQNDDAKNDPAIPRCTIIIGKNYYL
jgi:hypothetical protein